MQFFLKPVWRPLFLFSLVLLSLLLSGAGQCNSSQRKVHLSWIQNPRGEHKIFSEFNWENGALSQDNPDSDSVFFLGSGERWGAGWYSHMARLLQLEDSIFEKLGVTHWADEKPEFAFKVLDLGGRVRREVKVGVFYGGSTLLLGAVPTPARLEKLARKRNLDGFVLLWDTQKRGAEVRNWLVSQKGAGFLAVVLTQDIADPQEFGNAGGPGGTYLGMAIPAEDSAQHLFKAEILVSPQTTIPGDYLRWNWAWNTLTKNSADSANANPVLLPLQGALRRLFGVDPAQSVALPLAPEQPGAQACLLMQAWQESLGAQVAPVVLLDADDVSENPLRARTPWIDLLDLYPWGFDGREGRQSPLLLWTARGSDLVTLLLRSLKERSARGLFSGLIVRGARVEWVRDEQGIHLVRTLLREVGGTERELDLTESLRVLMPRETFEELSALSVEGNLGLDLTQWTSAQSEPIQTLVEYVRKEHKIECLPWNTELQP